MKTMPDDMMGPDSPAEEAAESPAQEAAEQQQMRQDCVRSATGLPVNYVRPNSRDDGPQHSGPLSRRR